MTNDRTLSKRAKLSIEAYISPAELRGAHNFATAAHPIMSLELQADPPATPAAAQPSPAPQTGPDLQADTASEAPSAIASPISYSIQAKVQPDVPASIPPELPDDVDAIAPPALKDQAPSSELVPHPVKETDFLIETRLSEPDPPFRAPSSWQVTHPQIGADRQWHWSERSTAAFLGFAAGVLIVVPLVIILSMTAEQPLPRATIEVSDAPVATEQAPVKPFIVANVAPATIEVAKDTQATAPAAKPPEAPEAPEAPTLIAQPPTEPKANSAIQEAESQARSALAVGQISEARAALRLAASPDNPQLWFVLAETYDPLITQGSGKSGATSATPADLSDKLTAADIKFAQFYYQQALTHGIGAARDRLAALQKP